MKIKSLLIALLLFMFSPIIQAQGVGVSTEDLNAEASEQTTAEQTTQATKDLDNINSIQTEERAEQKNITDTNAAKITAFAGIAAGAAVAAGTDHFFSKAGTALIDLVTAGANDTASAIASAIVPLMFTSTSILILTRGYLILTGESGDPVMQFVRQFIKLAIIIGFVYLYSSIYGNMIDIIKETQLDLANIISPQTKGAAGDVFSMLDDSAVQVIGVVVGGLSYLITQSVDGTGTQIFMVILLICFIAMGGGIVAACFFIILLSQLGLTLVLSLGPLFIAALAYRRTERLFDNWLSFVLNSILLYAVSTVIVPLINKSIVLAFEIGLTNIVESIVLLFIFGVSMLFATLSIPKITSALTSGLDVTDMVSGFATAKVAYSSPSWMKRSGGQSSKSDNLKYRK